MADLFSGAASPAEGENEFSEFCRYYPQASQSSWLNSTGHRDLVRIFGNSRFLAAFLNRHPEVVAVYARDPFRRSEKPLAFFLKEAQAAQASTQASAEMIAALKQVKYREYLRLTVRELAGDPQEEIYREYSHLCHAITRVLATAILREYAGRYGVEEARLCDVTLIAMGKLGGLELNYSSDIDLIGLYEAEADHEQISNHELFTKFFTRLGALLSGYDADGFLYRVDWDLRPEGKTGTLANSLDAMEIYYETFGEEWERQAFIKADTLFERNDLGRRFLDMMQPFVYRKYLDLKTIGRIRDMKSRIITELNKKKIDGINVKVGDGGIRDVEFLVQGLQLLHGGKNPRLRSRNTLEGLLKLEENGLLTPVTRQNLTAGYLFLRRLESALQMENEQQTHVLKSSAAERLKVARRMGIGGTPEAALLLFEEQLKQTQDFIHRTFKEFYDQ